MVLFNQLFLRGRDVQIFCVYNVFKNSMQHSLTIQMIILSQEIFFLVFFKTTQCVRSMTYLYIQQSLSCIWLMPFSHISLSILDLIYPMLKRQNSKKGLTRTYLIMSYITISFYLRWLMSLWILSFKTYLFRVYYHLYRRVFSLRFTVHLIYFFIISSYMRLNYQPQENLNIKRNHFHPHAFKVNHHKNIPQLNPWTERPL